MGNILIWLILLVTIPRWAATLAQVDKYTAFGIPITAIGEGIVLELGCWYIVRVFGAAKAKALEYRAKWEAHDQAMKEAGRNNRKPKDDPSLRGYRILMFAFLGLLFLTLAAQTPFIMSQFLPGETMASLLSHQVLWGYSVVLVISPELMTAAIALALHYDAVVRKMDGEGDAFMQVVRYVRERFAEYARGRENVAQVSAQSIEAAGRSAEPARKEPHRRARIDDWRRIYADLNGNRYDIDAATVADLVEAAGLALPSGRTLQNWAKEAREQMKGRLGE